MPKLHFLFYYSESCFPCPRIFRPPYLCPVTKPHLSIILEKKFPSLHHDHFGSLIKAAESTKTPLFHKTLFPPLPRAESSPCLHASIVSCQHCGLVAASSASYLFFFFFLFSYQKVSSAKAGTYLSDRLCCLCIAGTGTQGAFQREVTHTCLL